MNAYTRQDLSVMQAWPLDRKIRVTQAKIIEWYHHYGGKVAVSFSGGKDSTVLLDLARRAFPDIPAAFVDTGLEYPEIREFVKTVPNVTWLRPEMSFSKVISEYGYPVISKDVARRIRYARKGTTWALCHLNGLNRDGTPSKFNERYQKWRVLLDAPFFVSDQCCFIMKERPLHRYNRETGRKQIIATMACESARRQSVYLKIGCNAYHKRDPTSQPMSFWTEQDVLEYLRITGIPYASVYGEIVEKNGYKVVSMDILPDDRQMLSERMKEIADSNAAELILTTGGTGFSPRDIMPEATEDIVDRRVPGIPEAMRAYSMTITKRAMLSRATAGIRKKTLIINLPGSPKAVKESLEYIIDALGHGIEIMTGEAGNCARK